MRSAGRVPRPIPGFACAYGDGRSTRVISPAWCHCATLGFVCSTSTTTSPNSWARGTIAELPAHPTPGQLIVFGQSHGVRRSPLLVDAFTARILELSDGTRTVAKVLGELVAGDVDLGGSNRAVDPSAGSGIKWIENLFVHGLVSLRDPCVDPASEIGPKRVALHRDSPRPARPLRI